MRQGAMWLALAAMIVACGDSSGPVTPSMTGAWTATASTPGGTQFVIVLNLTQTDNSIGGTGSTELPNGTVVITLSVTGTHTYPQVSMTLSPTGSSAGLEAMAFQGEFSNPNTLSGQIDGSGFVATAINFSRE